MLFYTGRFLIFVFVNVHENDHCSLSIEKVYSINKTYPVFESELCVVRKKLKLKLTSLHSIHFFLNHAEYPFLVNPI